MSEAQGSLRTVLEQAGARSLRDLTVLPTGDVIALLDKLTIPPSEALLGALVLRAVDDLREGTKALDRGTERLLRLTRAVVILAMLTLAVAIVALAKG